MGRPRHASSGRLPPLALGMLCAAVLAAACAPVDPLETVLRERARFDVALLSWAERDDGKVMARVRISGPVRSELDKLTVEVRRFRADGSVIASEWVTLDVSESVMGAALESSLFLDPAGESPDSLGILLHPQPSAEQRVHLEELAGIR